MIMHTLTLRMYGCLHIQHMKHQSTITASKDTQSILSIIVSSRTSAKSSVNAILLAEVGHPCQTQ